MRSISRHSQSINNHNELLKVEGSAENQQVQLKLRADDLTTMISCYLNREDSIFQIRVCVMQLLENLSRDSASELQSALRMACQFAMESERFRALEEERIILKYSKECVAPILLESSANAKMAVYRFCSKLNKINISYFRKIQFYFPLMAEFIHQQQWMYISLFKESISSLLNDSLVQVLSHVSNISQNKFAMELQKLANYTVIYASLANNPSKNLKNEKFFLDPLLQHHRLLAYSQQITRKYFIKRFNSDSVSQSLPKNPYKNKYDIMNIEEFKQGTCISVTSSSSILQTNCSTASSARSTTQKTCNAFESLMEIIIANYDKNIKEMLQANKQIYSSIKAYNDERRIKFRLQQFSSIQQVSSFHPNPSQIIPSQTSDPKTLMTLDKEKTQNYLIDKIDIPEENNCLIKTSSPSSNLSKIDSDIRKIFNFNHNREYIKEIKQTLQIRNQQSIMTKRSLTDHSQPKINEVNIPLVASQQDSTQPSQSSKEIDSKTHFKNNCIQTINPQRISVYYGDQTEQKFSKQTIFINKRDFICNPLSQSDTNQKLLRKDKDNLDSSKQVLKREIKTNQQQLKQRNFTKEFDKFQSYSVSQNNWISTKQQNEKQVDSLPDKMKKTQDYEGTNSQFRGQSDEIDQKKQKKLDLKNIQNNNKSVLGSSSSANSFSKKIQVSVPRETLISNLSIQQQQLMQNQIQDYQTERDFLYFEQFRQTIESKESDLLSPWKTQPRDDKHFENMYLSTEIYSSDMQSNPSTHSHEKSHIQFEERDIQLKYPAQHNISVCKKFQTPKQNKNNPIDILPEDQVVCCSHLLKTKSSQLLSSSSNQSICLSPSLNFSKKLETFNILKKNNIQDINSKQDYLISKKNSIESLLLSQRNAIVSSKKQSQSSMKLQNELSHDSECKGLNISRKNIQINALSPGILKKNEWEQDKECKKSIDADPIFQPQENKKSPFLLENRKSNESNIFWRKIDKNLTNKKKSESNNNKYNQELKERNEKVMNNLQSYNNSNHNKKRVDTEEDFKNSVSQQIKLYNGNVQRNIFSESQRITNISPTPWRKRFCNFELDQSTCSELYENEGQILEGQQSYQTIYTNQQQNYSARVTPQGVFTPIHLETQGKKNNSLNKLRPVYSLQNSSRLQTFGPKNIFEGSLSQISTRITPTTSPNTMIQTKNNIQMFTTNNKQVIKRRNC